MNQQTQSSPRVHHFYVAIAKFLFHHSEHGIVSVRDPIKLKAAERYGLSPLILYGLTVAGLPIRWVTLSSVDQPRALGEVLLEAWSNAKGLRGRPDILRVNRYLAAACPELVQNMAKIGVRVEVADAKDKSLPASLRAAQESSRWLLRKHDRNDRSLARAIQSFCRYAQDGHNFRVMNSLSCVNSREVEDRVLQWLALPTQAPVPIAMPELEWVPGPWLSSWESSLPPDQPRYFNLDGFDGCTWLLTGEKAPEDIVEDDDLWADCDYDNAAEIAKNLVACWPTPPAEIAKSAGVTLRELKWFTSGKTSIEQYARFELEALLGIKFDESMGHYFGAGPYVLMAHKPQAIKEVYESISGCGDAYPCEIIPHQGSADPSWRYVLINTYGKPPSIVMASRGAKITERFPDLFMNYGGIKTVDPKFFQDVVSTCARACREPAANIREMTDFAKRYAAHWTNCIWQPG
ncbi:hypothetical protein ACK32N_20570 [Aeromonas caviae]|uniref:hypothetical protein n=1 Tax=Aeromonas caviae TaxID=648 RepID=UPI002B4959D8|nr:hypothetical protein [Aeromonas caviae]